MNRKWIFLALVLSLLVGCVPATLSAPSESITLEFERQSPQFGIFKVCLNSVESDETIMCYWVAPDAAIHASVRTCIGGLGYLTVLVADRPRDAQVISCTEEMVGSYYLAPVQVTQDDG